MKPRNFKPLAQFTAGIFGSTTLGIAGFLILMGYGGNYGCWATIDSLFNGAGYESCGAFGATTGVILGAIIGVIFASKAKINNYLTIAITFAVGAFVIPFIYALWAFWPPFEDGDMAFALPIIGAFLLTSIIPAALATLVANLPRLLKRKK